MSKRMLVISIVAGAAVLVFIWTLVDRRNDAEDIPVTGKVTESQYAAPPAVGAGFAAALGDTWRVGLDLTRAVAMALGAGGSAIDTARRPPSVWSWLVPGRGPRRPLIDEPGDEPVRIATKREVRVPEIPYTQPPRGERTILASGHRVERAIQLPRLAGDLLARDVTEATDVRGAGAGAETEAKAAVRALVCVDRRGKPSDVRVEDGTGVDSVDAAIARQLMTDRYRPLRRDGRLVSFCERVTVVVPPRAR
jgi:hypothetical protein